MFLRPILSLHRTVFPWRRLSSSVKPSFVPDHELATNDEVRELEQLVNSSDSVLVLTGAGISTESGLPDYRSERVGLFARTNHKPITIQEFVNSEPRRRMYWARNFVAWDKFAAFEPSIAHHTLTQWQKAGKVPAIITQNVDRLHQKAGSENVVELHGNGFTVACLSCPYQISRHDFQKELSRVNNEWNFVSSATGEMRPDGDVQLQQKDIDSFHVPDCPSCGGLLKPTVVFFGDNVPRSVVEQSHQLNRETDLLLVIGSSLHVFSGYRFVAEAHEMKKKIVIVNIGPTRADSLSDVIFLRRRAGDILPQVRI